MKVFVVKIDDLEERCFSTLRKALKLGDDVRTMTLDIDSLPKEGCTLAVAIGLEMVAVWRDELHST